MTWHPTTNRVQFCHLTPEEQEALEDWPHGWEYFVEGLGSWTDTPSPCWVSSCIYRGKPAPVVMSVWLNVYVRSSSISHKSREEADVSAGPNRIDVLRIDTCNGVSTAHL
jgi:hypothetical protein